MRIRRLLVILLILSGIAFAGRELRRGFLAFLLYRGDNARLERWGGERTFIPALRHLYSPSGKEASCRDGLAPWATRRFRPRFPDDDVMDLSLLPSNELILLLRRDPSAQAADWRDDSRLVVLDLNRSECVVAESERFSINAWGFEVRYFSAWPGPTLFVHGGGTGSCGMLFRRQGTGFLILRCKEGRGAEPYFSCWIDLRLIDTDGDGIPEVQGGLGKFTNCPACGREAEYNRITWKLIDGIYRKWTERGADCGLHCELAWSN